MFLYIYIYIYICYKTSLSGISSEHYARAVAPVYHKQRFKQQPGFHNSHTEQGGSQHSSLNCMYIFYVVVRNLTLPLSILIIIVMYLYGNKLYMILLLN